MADAVVPFAGWGRDGWGELAWGEGDVPVGSATGAVGTVTVEADADVPTTGLEATGAVGSVVVTGTASISVTGVEATGAVGTVVAVADAIVSATGVQATGAVGTVVVNANAGVPVTGNQLTQNFSPEYDLTLTGALPAGQISGTFTNRGQSIVFAGEVQLPSSFTQTECLWEHGGEGTGAFLGVSKILDTYYLRFRAGEGSNAVQDNTPDDICLQNVAISSIPEFDGNTHTVVFELKPSAPSRIQLWIDGREVINTEKATAMEAGVWAGSDVGGWGAGFSGIAGGTSVTDSGTTQYQAATAWSGTIVSPLRY